MPLTLPCSNRIRSGMAANNKNRRSRSIRKHEHYNTKPRFPHLSSAIFLRPEGTIHGERENPRPRRHFRSSWAETTLQTSTGTWGSKIKSWVMYNISKVKIWSYPYEYKKQKCLLQHDFRRRDRKNRREGDCIVLFDISFGYRKTKYKIWERFFLTR